MYAVTLKKIEGGTRIRTTEAEGMCSKYPTIGESFEMICKSIVPGSVARIITTSIVQDVIIHDDSAIIETLNSKYRLYFN